MIFESLSCVTEEINEYFRSKLKVNEDKVIISGIVNQDGTVAVQGENKVLLTLVNIEKDNSGQSNGSTAGVKIFPNTSLPVKLNIYVLFSSYFAGNNYPEALRFLSFVVSYFQNKSVFNKANTPRMAAGIEKLIFEMENLSTEKLNNVWTTLGGKYMPSVMYKVRMLTFDDSIIREFRPKVSGVSKDNSQ